VSGPNLRAEYPTPDDYLAVHDAEVAKGGLFVRGASIEGAAAMAECALQIVVAGQAAAEVPARIAAVVPGHGVAVVFEGVPAGLEALAARLRAGEAPGKPDDDRKPAPGTVTERLKALTVTQKMSLALSCDRETRMALMRDTNKTLHLYVLKNPRLGLDEVQHAAKMATLSPDAIKVIAEHKEWGLNSTICTSLVRNPKTPTPLALRLLPRVPLSEVRAIAKGGARDAIVHAARKLVNPK
jgi:hypothetical protein